MLYTFISWETVDGAPANFLRSPSAEIYAGVAAYARAEARATNTHILPPAPALPALTQLLRARQNAPGLSTMADFGAAASELGSEIEGQLSNSGF
jgi:hypothetical protein